MRFRRFQDFLLYILIATVILFLYDKIKSNKQDLFYLAKNNLNIPGNLIAQETDVIDLSKYTFYDKFCNQNNYLNKTNPHNYKYILNPEYSICKDGEILAIAFISIKTDSFEKRKQIRSTWANVSKFPKLRIIFALGLASDPKIEKLIVEESKKYNDIVQEDFVDTYYNLTTKMIMSFKWISEYCDRSPFILRINDDVVLNTPIFLKYLERLLAQNNGVFKYSLIGDYASHKGPHRDKDDKYYVSYEQFNGTLYDPFVYGNAYILTTDLARYFYLLSEMRNCPPFSTWMEDVYFGILAKNIKANIIAVNRHFNYYDRPDENLVKQHPELFDNMYLSVVWNDDDYKYFIEKFNVS